MKYLVKGLSYFILLLLLNGCRGCSDRGSGILTNDDDVGKDSVYAPIAVEKVNFFLENSKSMAGYIYYSTYFSTDVDQVLVKLNQRYESKVFPFTVGEGLESYNGDLLRFREDLNPTNKKRISIDDSSLLHNIFKKVIDTTGQNDISILVTDGIMSGSNTDLANYDEPKENKYFNIDNVNSSLKGDVTLALQAAAKENKVVKILAYHSDFHTGKKIGKVRYYYYKADNNKHSGSIRADNNILPNRPYYFFIFGNEKCIRAFEEETKGVFNPIKTIELGFNYKQVAIKLTNASQLKSHTRVKTQERIHELAFEKGAQPYKFSVLLNLSEIDIMFNSKEYIQNYLKLKVNNIYFNNPEIIDLNKDHTNDLWFSGTNSNEYKGYSHLATFELEDYTPNVSDDIYLQFVNDVEYWSGTEEWSNENDLGMKAVDSTTFGLKYLIQGIKDAYYNEEDVYIFNERITKIKTY